MVGASLVRRRAACDIINFIGGVVREKFSKGFCHEEKMKGRDNEEMDMNYQLSVLYQVFIFVDAACDT